MMQYHIKDLKLSKEGKKRIEWASLRMPVLNILAKRYEDNKPLKGVKIGACLHVTTETANLVISLKKAGAKIRLCASNPLSTQDDVASSLVKDYGIEVFAIKGEDKKTYYQHIDRVLELEPQITLDDGADLVATIHRSYKKSISWLPWAGTEETTTGVVRLRSLERQNKLLYPIIAVNDALTKFMFDNRYGTGQSTLDGILRATNFLIAGTNFVVCGYGWCGRGIAYRARGLGARVIVVETDPLKALEACMDGFWVMPIKDACKIGDIFVTATGNIDVIRKEHFLLMKDRVLLANAGHFNVEIDIEGLESISTSKRKIKNLIDEYVLEYKGKKKRLYLLGEGRLVNLACAEGHPAQVMDMSFANQFLSCIYIKNNYPALQKKVYKVPEEIDREVASLKLEEMGINIDKMIPSQKRYMQSWELGT